MSERMYQFNWDFIGDIGTGRPNLGPNTRVEVYRLFQYTLRDVLEKNFGTEKADKMLFEAGKLAGGEYFNHYLAPCDSINTFVAKAQESLRSLGVGILRVEKANLDNFNFTLSVMEDLDCSGLPELAHGVCTYDEGFLAGLFEAFSGKPFVATEIDCWCTGDRTCRFKVVPAKVEA